MSGRLRRLLVRLHLRKPNTYEQEILAESPLVYWRLDGLTTIDEFNDAVVDDAWTGREDPYPWPVDYPQALIYTCDRCENWTLEIRESISHDDLAAIWDEHRADCPVQPSRAGGRAAG